MEIIITQEGSTEVTVNEAEYRAALETGTVDQLLDAYASDMDVEMSIVEPDGTIRDYPSGEIVSTTDE